MSTNETTGRHHFTLTLPYLLEPLPAVLPEYPINRLMAWWHCHKSRVKCSFNRKNKRISKSFSSHRPVRHLITNGLWQRSYLHKQFTYCSSCRRCLWAERRLHLSHIVYSKSWLTFTYKKGRKTIYTDQCFRTGHDILACYKDGH